MARKSIVKVWLFLLVVMMAVGCGLVEAPKEAGAPIEAIPLASETPAQDVVADEGPADAAQTGAAGPAVYQISSEDSSVRFELDEDLRGQRKTVVGQTNQVAGEIAVDLNDLSTAQVGTIQVNARTLATDNNLRNRAIQNWILETVANEFITFTPTAVNGLPDSVSLGETANFTLVGDLTIRDITQEVTWEVEATPRSQTELAGTASTSVQRADYDLSIPNVPNVANVEEEVVIIIDFVARAAG